MKKVQIATMNRLILSIFIILFSVGCAPEVAEKVQNDDTIRVLFVGNSHTFTNDVPNLVRRINDAQSDSPAVKVSSATAPGYHLHDHVTEGVAQRVIANGEWDFVVIQPASPEAFRNPDDQISNFHVLIDSAGPKTTPILYGIWHREEGDDLYAAVGTTPGGAARTIRETNLATIRDTRARLAPVGDAWVTAQLRHQEIPLYTDGNHASLEGSYLAAAVILRAILHQPLDTTRVWSPRKLRRDTAIKLLDVANTVSLVSP